MKVKHYKRASAAFSGLKRNFMTPRAIAYCGAEGPRGFLACELSEGEGVDRARIFGVSFRGIMGERIEGVQSRLCHSRREAEALIVDTLRAWEEGEACRTED